MKTYLFDSLARFKRFSESLDIATTLSNKTWVVFNDSGERELYIFKPDGSVFITTNGIGYKGTWEWISANKSLIIQHDQVIYMLHPEIVEECVLVLTLDGTKDCVFLIEDQNRQSFAPKTLTQLQNHFEAKERKVIEAQKAETVRRVNEQMRAEEERKRREAEKRKEMEKVRREAQRREEKYLQFKAHNIIRGYEVPWDFLITMEVIIIVTLAITTLCLIFHEDWRFYAIIPILCFVLFIIIAIYTRKIGMKRVKENIVHYITKHPNDPACKYLKIEIQ